MSSYKIINYAGPDPELKPYKSMIYSDFMKSLRYGNEWFGLIDSDIYYMVYAKLIQQLLNRTDVLVRLSVLTDDIDTCLGWSLSERNMLHYLFVKKDFQRQGIGKSLLPKEFDTVTHLTKIGQAIRKRSFPHVVFNPFIL